MHPALCPAVFPLRDQVTTHLKSSIPGQDITWWVRAAWVRIKSLQVVLLPEKLLGRAGEL